MIESLGIIPEKRLAYLPTRHWHAHEFSFFIHDQLARLLTEYEAAGVHSQVAEAFEQALIAKGIDPQDFDLIEFLKNNQFDSLYQRHLLGHLVIALTSDFCHFIYEALTAFEKRKFAVGYSLLRKPLKENLLFLCWILGNRHDFITRFEKNNYQTLNHLSKEKQTEIYQQALDLLPFNQAYEANFLWGIIYSKTETHGLEPIWQKATHLITSKGNLLRTGDYTINFIFHDPRENDLYDRLYLNLPYVLMFCMHVILECFSSLQKINDKTYSHLLLTALGTYESLFSSQKLHIAPLLNKQLGFFLKCVHCKGPLKINKKNGA